MSEGWWVIGGVVVGALASGVINLMLQKRRFAHEKEMLALRNQASENVKLLLTEMLSHKSYTDRSFEVIRKKVGGYTDDEVRQLLHEIGAKKVITQDNGEKEWWYLASREVERVEKRKSST